MKKIYVFLLSLFCLLSLATNVWGETYNLVDFSSILTGDEIIIIGTKSGTNYAMANTGTPPKPISTGISITSNTLTTDLTTITFKATKNSDGTITFVSTAGGTLYCINDNNGVKIGTVSTNGNANFSFDTSVKRLKNPVTGTARWLGIYNTQDWRCYTSSSASNISGTTTTFYKKVTTSTTTYSVTWKVGGEVYTTGNPTTSVADGSKVTTLPTAPADGAIGACADTFMGWSTSNLGSTAGQSAPDVLFTTAADAPAIIENTTFYAVFAKATTTEGGSGSSTTLTYGWEEVLDATMWEQSNLSDAKVYNSYKHTGTYGASTNSKTTAYIKTKEKIASPTSAICYYTKASSNSNSTSYFVIQVSTDGTSWTDAAKGKTMDKVTQGKFESLTADLSSYSDVYVRFYYTGTNAVRVIDDVSVTCAGGSSTTYTDYVTDCVDCTQEGADCPEYPVVLNDRGTETEAGTYWVGEEIPEPKYKPQGGCEGYEFAGWTTEQGLNNLTAAEWENKKISFPYRMPLPADADAGITFYAMYKSTLSDEYRWVQNESELTDGEYVITASTGGKEYALSFVRSELITEFGSKEATFEEGSSTVIVTADPEIIWTLTNVEGGYTLEALHFDGMQKQAFLNINNQYMMFEETARPYTISASGSKFTFCSAAEGGACMVFNGSTFEAGATATPLYLYKRVQDTRYSTSTACDPSIISVGTVAVTSAPGIWVEAVTQPYIFAERLQSNRDKAASVDIIATSKTEQFTLKPVGATGEGNASLTLKAGEIRDNFADRFMVVYKPTRDSVIDEGEIVVKAVNPADHNKEYAVHTIHVKGRSLPKHFVIAAQTEKGWVALPADLGTSSLAVLKAPYRIEVDDVNDPAVATKAPETALYHAAERFDDNTNPRGVHLMNSSGMRLCGDYSKEPDNRLWFDNDPVTNSQSWALRSLALKDYYIRLQAAPAGNYLFYNATTGGGKIGYYEYKQQNRLRLRLLPVAATCVRYDAPVVQVAQLQSESVTLEWPDVQNGVEYEYTLDGGLNWTPFGTEHGWEVKSGVNTATISGLTPEKDYTVSVRVAVGEGQDNCSEECTRPFTMPLCDDVPHHLWATATADSVTIVWEAKAATATVRLYSDEAGTHTVAEDTDAESPHSIKGLTQNTKYWYQVFAGDKGTCASAIASFTTESNDISIVEWEKEAVIVDINTEVADGVSVVVEKRVEHGAGNKNIAEDLFFSKYYEATYNVKLLGIFNGTNKAVDLSNLYIYVGTDNTQPWSCKLSLSGLVANDLIAPNQEIIIWYHQNTAYDKKLVNCIGVDTEQFIWSPKQIAFSGRQAILLIRGTEIIDIIGAIKDNNVSIDKVQPVDGKTQPSWGDAPGFVGWGYSIEDKTTPIELSTNRCLLVRSSSVKSGQKAVEKNVGKFTTLGDGEIGVTADCEWLGRQVLKETDDGVESSCAGFSYVADFDYNDYYTTFEGMDTVKIDGKKNPNGTYTIPVKRLDTLACNDIRLQLTKNGEVTASVEQKVPIIVDKTITTADKTYFPESLTDEICSTCDVVVRGEQKLTHNIGARKFRNMYIYHGSRLEIDPAAAIQLEKLRMFALNDDVSYAIINNSAKEGEGSTPSIYVKEISHVKRIDGQYWYPFSLPYNCYIKDISALNGRELGEYSMDWGIKYYDGQKRQAAGKSAAAGQTSDFWYMMPADGMLEAYKGYIIGLFTGDEMHQKSINFAPANINTYTETDKSKTTYVENWTDNLEAAARHHGWNFTGSPYISLFGSAAAGEGLNNAKLQMGRTNPKTGEQEETDFVYVSIPDGADSRTYTQQLASATQVKPFSAYFVQAIDPAKGASKGESISLTYSKTNRSLTEQAANPTLAPRRSPSRDEVLFAELVLRASGPSASGMSDNAGVLVSNRFSTEYEIGYDLTKMYAAADKPQLYTLASDNEKMAYNAVPDLWGQHVPLGIYVPSAGDYTLSLNPSASRLEHAESVLLLYNGGIAANLLTGDYTLSAAGKGSVSGYSLDIRRSREIATDTEASAVGMTGVGVQNGELVLLNLPGDADVAVYDMLGRVLLSTRTTGDTPQISVPDLPTGIYTAVVTTAENQQIFKTMLR